jgi:hypothetical protein
MGKKNRAERRHHHQRMLDKVKKFRIYEWFFWTEDQKLRHQRKVAETRKPCSCDMCCNPRHSDLNKDKLTMQEKRFKDYGNDY